jgi:tetratricopeptide (TPR) repeat protein
MLLWTTGRLPKFSLILLLTCSCSSVLAQNSSPTNTPTPAADAIAEKAPPFDKLELFAFLAAGPYPPFAAAAIRKRGVDFIPKDSFLLSYPSAPIREALARISPVNPRPLPPNRRQSLVLLTGVAVSIRDKRCAGAAQDLQEALRLAPDSASLHFSAAACAMSLQDWPQLEKESRESLRLWPGNADACNLLAYALNNQGRGQEAVPEAREALRIFPDHKGAIMQLGIALSRSGQHAEAIPFLVRSSALNKQVSAVEKFLGYALLETNQPSQAVDPLSSYLKRVPNDAEAHYLLGVALRALGRKDEAQPQFDEALKIEPHNERYRVANNPDASSPSSDRPSRQKPDQGSVSGNLYSNNFFQFTYEFPEGWTVLSSEAGRALVEFGGALISTGDPTEAETKMIAMQIGSPLLTLMQRREKNQALATKFIQIVAFDAQDAPNMNPILFLTAIADRLKQSGPGFELLDAPRKVTIGSRDFANVHLAIHMTNGQAYTSQFVTKERGFLLMINLSAPDQQSLPILESTLNTLHFLRNPD